MGALHHDLKSIKLKGDVSMIPSVSNDALNVENLRLENIKTIENCF